MLSLRQQDCRTGVSGFLTQMTNVSEKDVRVGNDTETARSFPGSDWTKRPQRDTDGLS